MKPQSGFTLFEILVVMLLIGIILSIAGLSIGDGGLAQKQKHEAQRLRTLLQMALDQALMSQTELGLALSLQQYRFVAKRGDDWVPLADEIFMSRQLPAGMTLSLEVEGLPLELGDSVDTPQIVLYSSAEATAFRLWLVSESGRGVQELTGDITGTFSLSQRTWDEVDHFLQGRVER
jgi:general secretion pathway protein H